MNSPTFTHLTNLILQRERLKKIRADMDPASGVSFAVRRGVARNNDEVEDDETRRPWATIEICSGGHAEQVIDVLLLANMASIVYARASLEKELKAGAELLTKAPSP